MYLGWFGTYFWTGGASYCGWFIYAGWVGLYCVSYSRLLGCSYIGCALFSSLFKPALVITVGPVPTTAFCVAFIYYFVGGLIIGLFSCGPFLTFVGFGGISKISVKIMCYE